MKESLVYTVIGEHGNSDGPYTYELPSLSAALEACAREDFPRCPIGRGGVKRTESRISFTVSSPLVYSIVAHEPLSVIDHVATGGVHEPVAVFDFRNPKPVDGEPGVWTTFREMLAEVESEFQSKHGGTPTRPICRSDIRGGHREVLTKMSDARQFDVAHDRS